MTVRPRRVVVLGGGFGGLYAASYLAAADLPGGACEILLVSRTNYFTFTPLLAEVVAGTLGREHVTVPYRVIADARGFGFMQATVEGLDPGRGIVHTSEGPVPYDFLLVALGARPRYFGNDRLAAASLAFTSIGEALAIRDRVLGNAERAAHERDPARRRRLLSFAVAGAGPAGVEVASEIAHLLRHVLPRYYGVRDLPAVVVLEGGDRILPGFDERLARDGLAVLERRGVEVRLGRRVAAFDDGLVQAAGPEGTEGVEAGTLIWTAGTAPSTGPLASAPLAVGPSGHLELDRYLHVRGEERVFGVGDATSLVDERTGRRYPPVAPIAISQGIRAAGNIENAVVGRALEPYHAHHAGKIVSLGGGVALVDILGWRVTGPLAWAIYRAAYLLKLVGAKNKIRAGVTLLLNHAFERDLTCEA